MGCVQSSSKADLTARELEDEQARRASDTGASPLETAPPDEDSVVTFAGAVGDEDSMDKVAKKIGQSGPLTSLEYSRRIVSSEGVLETPVPSANFSLRVAYVSQRGYYPESLNKANQDAFCYHTRLGGSSDVFAGVFDGHGEHGTPCAEFAKDKIPELLAKDPARTGNLKKALFNSFTATNAKIHASAVDDSMSGTTAICAHISGNSLAICNVGDSRAIAGEDQGGKVVAVDLSHDQTPFRDDECARVRKAGARVLTLDQIEGLKDPNVKCWGTEEDDEGDPPRLWVPNGMYPGTAFTRSIGDHVAEKIGVFAEPEILERQLTPSTRYIVLASDGVFEFLPSQTVMDMVTSHGRDLHEAALEIVVESYRLWLQYETRTDDITIIIMELDWSGRGGASMGAPRISKGEAIPAGMNRPVRRMLSRAKRAAIEAANDTSMESDALDSYEPPKNLPHKSQEDLDQLNLAVKNNFLFAHIHPEQKSIIFAVMEKIEVKRGDTIIKQGDRGDAFYVICKGEFDVFIANKPEEGIGAKVHTYKSSKTVCPSFGELSLMYGQPRAASVIASTDGSLWRLDRSAYKGLLSKADRKQLIRTLRTVDVLASLNFGQLQRLADIMTSKTYEPGTHIINQGDTGNEFYIVQEGNAVCTIRKDPTNKSENPKEVLKLGPGQYFGERALLSNAKRAANVIAQTRVKVLMLDRQLFETHLGELKNIIDSDRRWRERVSKTNDQFLSSPLVALSVQTKLDDFEPKSLIWTSDAGVQVAMMQRRGQNVKHAMRTVSLPLANKCNTSKVVLRWREVSRSLPPSSFIPAVLKTFKTEKRLHELLYCSPRGSFQSIFLDEENNPSPLPEEVIKYYGASMVLALSHLHMAGAVLRSMDPLSIAVTDEGNMVITDLRYAKYIENGRTFTLCGSPEYFAPEMLSSGGGHGVPADVYMLGVFLYHLSYRKTPFADAKDEPAMYAEILERPIPPMKELNPKLADLIAKLMEKDPLKRLGSGKLSDIMDHPFFASVNFGALEDLAVEVPRKAQELVNRFKDYDFQEFDDAHLPQGDASWASEF